MCTLPLQREATHENSARMRDCEAMRPHSRSGSCPVSLSARGLATVGGPNLGLGAKAYEKNSFRPVAIYHPDRGDVLGDDVVQGGPVDWEQFTCGVELNERPVVIEQIVHDLGELIGKGRDILVAVQPAPTMLVSVAELIVLNVHGDLVLLQLVPGGCRITLQEAWRVSGCRQPARPFRWVGSVKPDAAGPVTGSLQIPPRGADAEDLLLLLLL